MREELKQALEDYADKIHQRWLNARDCGLAEAERIYNNVDNELRKMLKEDEARAKALISRLKVRHSE